MKTMMKIISAMLIAALLLAGTAMAETKTYIDRDKDLTFLYDDASLKIAMEDETDDELLVILDGTDPAWGNVFVKIHLADLDEDRGETFPTLADFAELEKALNTTVTQGDWNGFRNVFSYEIDDGDAMEYVFIAPVYDDDHANEVEDILTITIGIDKIEDEEAGMQRDDAISEVLDTLNILDD